MNQQKGFSLTEVLVSLMLVSTVALALLEQQWQTRHLLHKLVLRIGASQFLDHIDESLWVHLNKLPTAPIPYQFSMEESAEQSLLHIDWSNFYDSLTRRHRHIGCLK